MEGEGAVVSADILATSSALPHKEVQAPIVRLWTVNRGAQQRCLEGDGGFSVFFFASLLYGFFSILRWLVGIFGGF